MKPVVLRALVLSMSLVMAGCGTVVGRMHEGEPAVDTYKGVNSDLHLIGLRPGPSGSGNAASIMCLISLVCPVLVVVSLPVDAVVDTLLLPADILSSR